MASVVAGAAFLACSDETLDANDNDTKNTTSARDGGFPVANDTDNAPPNVVPPRTDASTDASTAGDACADGGCAAPKGCAAQSPDIAFCDDFDNPNALTVGSTKWDFVEASDQPVLTLSSTQSVSAPSSLLSQIIDGTSPGAKVAKTITKANLTEATWEYDVYFENIGTTDGFFLDDFQFSDDGGGDRFGFRLVMFSNAGGVGDFRVEHNPFAIGGEYVIEPNLPEGAVTLGAWYHFKHTVKFAFATADAGDGGANTVTYSLWINGVDAAPSTTPTFEKTYPGASRAQINFARFAAMPLVFDKGHTAGLKIYWDNHTVDLK